MDDFPGFMKRVPNRIAASDQNTDDVEGYFYTARDGSQMAFWTALKDRTSRKHVHEFDEYMIVISGRYTAYLDGKEHVLGPGDELYIPKGTKQWGRCIAGTRTIHAFGERRIPNRPG